MFGDYTVFRFFILVAIVAFGLDYYTEGKSTEKAKDYIDNFIHEATVAYYIKTKGITSIKCDDIAKMVEGMELQNMFGAKYKILYIDTNSMQESSRTNTFLTCYADAKLTNGDSRLDIKLEILGDEWLYSVKEIR